MIVFQFFECQRALGHVPLYPSSYCGSVYSGFSGGFCFAFLAFYTFLCYSEFIIRRYFPFLLHNKIPPLQTVLVFLSLVEGAYHIITRQEPGIASLDNFEEIRAYLDASLERYRNIVYTDENLKAAKDDKRTLSSLKRKLDDRRKEIKKIYMAPYQKIEAQLKELMGMIDGPLEEIDAFVKQTELNEKQRQMLTIRGFYDEAAAPLGDLAGALFDSPAFFDPKWENKSTSVKAWQDAIRDKVAQTGQAIKTIQAAGGKHTAALISKYLETLDMDETLRYRKTLEAAEHLSGARVDEVEDEDRVKGYKVLKVTGTRQQMTQLME